MTGIVDIAQLDLREAAMPSSQMPRFCSGRHGNRIGLVEFMASSGFGCLVAALKRVRQHEKRLCLCGINSQLRSVLELAGVDQIIPIVPAVDDFIAQQSL